MHQFIITDKIKQLEIEDIKENLFHYSYDNKSLKALVKNNTSKEDLSYISAYSSFKGEIYENIVYELLLQYALTQDEITRFVLKGPYQDKENLYIKSGLLIDSSSQIVYKSAYKDISEFDALFFTKDSVYFVEMSTSKKTSSLNKRLTKKYALLKMIFPTLTIKALIVVTIGSTGLKNFPPYATIWLTNDLEDEELIEKIIFAKKVKNDEFYTQYHDIEKEITAYLEYNPDVFSDKVSSIEDDSLVFYVQKMHHFEDFKLIWLSQSLIKKLKLHVSEFYKGISAFNDLGEEVLKFNSWKTNYVGTGYNDSIKDEIPKNDGSELIMRRDLFKEFLKIIDKNETYYKYKKN